MKLLERRKDAIKQLEKQLENGTKPTRLSAANAKLRGFKKYDGKFREPLNGNDIYKKKMQIEILKERIK